MKNTASEVESKICAGLKPKPMPLALQRAFDALPDDLDTWTSEMIAIDAAVQKEAADGKTWLKICS